VISYLIFGITYAFAAAAQPGPFQTYIISETLSKGWKKTLPAAFAPLISDIPVVVIVLFLLSNVPVMVLNILQLAGGIFLIYLAYGAYNTWRSFDVNKKVEVHSGSKTMMKAALVNFLNPNPYIGWSLIMGPLFLKGYHETPSNGIALLVSFYSTLIVCSMGIMILFSFAKNLGPKVNRASIGISALALLLFGAYQIIVSFGKIL
jgi:threonine/homoserine/homoserine lactone efflux protein